MFSTRINHLIFPTLSNVLKIYFSSVICWLMLSLGCTVSVLLWKSFTHVLLYDCLCKSWTSCRVSTTNQLQQLSISQYEWSGNITDAERVVRANISLILNTLQINILNYLKMIADDVIFFCTTNLTTPFYFVITSTQFSQLLHNMLANSIICYLNRW